MQDCELLGTEDEDTTVPRNVRNCSSIHTVSHPIRLGSSATLLGYFQISCLVLVAVKSNVTIVWDWIACNVVQWLV